MPKYVIDTNVPIVANGDSADVTVKCRLASVELLIRALGKGVIFLDSGGEIQNEYRRYLNPRGEPGVGDRFYLEVINSDPQKIARVDVEKDEAGRYVDLPAEIAESSFDQGDRVFAAVAKRARARVYNAVDTDWLQHKAAIKGGGVEVVFLCGENPDAWRENVE